MSKQKTHISYRRLRTPRVAAVAGIIFAILWGASYVLIQLTIPPIPLDKGEWWANQAGKISLGLSLLPFAGIAFLWFMGVLRDRLGYLEDQFFSTLFFGSGLLYLAMTFVSSSIAGGMLAIYALDPDLLSNSGAYLIARAVSIQITTVYAVRMSGMFMFVLGTIWMRTQVMPRWLAIVTYGLATALLISVGLTEWVMLVFPAWVFLVSVYTLILNWRAQSEKGQDGMTVDA